MPALSLLKRSLGEVGCADYYMEITTGVHLREEKQETFTAVVIEMNTIKKMIFPAFLLAFQVVFLIFFGVFVTYDNVVPPDGSVTPPSNSSASPLESTKSTAKTYPCEFMSKLRIVLIFNTLRM